MSPLIAVYALKMQDLTDAELAAANLGLAGSSTVRPMSIAYHALRTLGLISEQGAPYDAYLLEAISLCINHRVAKGTWGKE